MNKTSLKIFICFTLTASVVATILLVINYFGTACIVGSDISNLYDNSPRKTLAMVEENLTHTENGFVLPENIIPDEYWCILISENGSVIWSENMPYDIPQRYSINDVARMTRWFLNDYPVYVRTEDYGLLVIGMPKDAVAKYEMEYSMQWFDTLPQRILTIFVINLCFAAILAFIFGIRFYQRLRTLINGISDLRKEKQVRLNEKGIFKEISVSINRTSDSIERKNITLAERDRARSNWIAGISHDIRTPLSVIMGYSETLSESGELSEENKNKAETITAQSIKIKKLIEDLNLISSLEYDMQPSKKSSVRICPLIRRIITDIINSGLPDDFEIELNLHDEKAAVPADESLIERAVFNIINNSITHNKSGCKISIDEYSESGNVYLNISDNGKGVPDEVIEHIAEIPKSSHGLGLPMAYRIIYVHGGKMTLQNRNGFFVNIKLPSE